MNDFTKKIAVDAAVTIAGAVLAAFLVGRYPPLRNWIKNQWNGGQ